MTPDRAHIAAEIDERVTDSGIHGNTGQTINGILLADAAEIYLHSCAREAYSGALPDHLLPSDEWQNLRKLLLAGQTAITKSPGAAENS
jgi:hypothetical protein